MQPWNAQSKKVLLKPCDIFSALLASSDSNASSGVVGPAHSATTPRNRDDTRPGTATSSAKRRSASALGLT